MTARNDRAEDRQALSRLLDTCGADRTRWPARERLRFAGFISEDAEAQRMLSEARALDALLDCAPRASEEREHALKERIVASALRSGATSFTVVPASAQAAATAPQVAPARSPVLRRFATVREWPAAAVLAASLVVGVMLGSAGTFDTTAQEMAEAAGFATAGAPSQLALGEEMLASADEELL